MEIKVSEAPERMRYEATSGGQVIGFADYRLENDVVTIPHTKVGPAYEGKGVGSAIARFALDDIRHRNLRVVPACPFIKVWIERHREYSDLVVDSDTDGESCLLPDKK